jgi:hypothetical protein
VYNAMKEVAGTSYVAMFDIGGQSSNLLFASEKYDKSDSVLRKLGIRPDKDGEGEHARGQGVRRTTPEEQPEGRTANNVRIARRPNPVAAGHETTPMNTRSMKTSYSAGLLLSTPRPGRRPP